MNGFKGERGFPTFTYVKLKKETSKSSSWGVLECARADGSHVAITSSKWPMAVTEMPKGLSLCGTASSAETLHRPRSHYLWLYRSRSRAFFLDVTAVTAGRYL